VLEAVGSSGRKIIYSPSAVVWHHRRGYGRFLFTPAERLRLRGGRHTCADVTPADSIVSATPSGRGGVYDTAHVKLASAGLPAIFRPRVYQGQFGGAQFQSLYQPFLSWWFQVFTLIPRVAIAGGVHIGGGAVGLLA